MWKLIRQAHWVTCTFAGILNSSDVCLRGTEITCSFRTQPASDVWGRVAWTASDCWTVGPWRWNSPSSSTLAVHVGATSSTDAGTQGPEASTIFIHLTFHCFGLGKICSLHGSNNVEWRFLVHLQHLPFVSCRSHELTEDITHRNCWIMWLQSVHNWICKTIVPLILLYKLTVEHLLNILWSGRSLGSVREKPEKKFMESKFLTETLFRIMWIK